MADDDDRGVLVSMMFFEASGGDGIRGTAMSWIVEDLTIAGTLKDQLLALLGEPCSQVLLPDVAIARLKSMPSSWPGAVHVNRDDT